jgi:hypothetical protein
VSEIILQCCSINIYIQYIPMFIIQSKSLQAGAKLAKSLTSDIEN